MAALLIFENNKSTFLLQSSFFRFWAKRLTEIARSANKRAMIMKRPTKISKSVVISCYLLSLAKLIILSIADGNINSRVARLGSRGAKNDF